METQYFRQYSPALGRDMELKVYGHAGQPMLFIPCQDGRFFDFENYRMADTCAPWIESGQLMVFSIDTLDRETWSDKSGDPYWRIRRYEQWIRYITDEVVPFAQNMVCARNNWESSPGLIAFGCSLGATHAANLFFRRPDLFGGLLALSGIYTAEYGFGSYMDDVTYNNSPVHFLPNMPLDHPYIEMYNQRREVICVGQGPWEIPHETRRLQGILENRGIHAWVDYWGWDCEHDWPWWYKQVAYFMPYLLGN